MSKKNKNPNIINVGESLFMLQTYGLKADIFNDYQIRMFEDESGDMWDWFHTTGSLCSFKKGLCRKVGIFKTAEDVALHIQKSMLK